MRKSVKKISVVANMHERKQRARRIVAELKKLFPDAHIALTYSSNWELLVAVILSAQCTDKKVNEVTNRLFLKYKCLDDYVRAKQSVFEKDIHATGFYRNKAKNIQAAATMILEKFGGKIPKTMTEMLEIPGVARKTANIVLGNAYHIYEGIAVDTHVRKQSQRFGFSKNENTDKIEQDLMQVLPRKEWFATTYRLIEYGRKYCVAKRHNHAQCPLSKVLKD